MADRWTRRNRAGSRCPSIPRIVSRTVKAAFSSATYKVHVPEGAYVALSKRGNTDHYLTSVPFELARRGNHVNVKVSAQAN